MAVIEPSSDDWPCGACGWDAPLVQRRREEAEVEVERLQEALRVVLSFGTTLPPGCREIVLEALNG